MAKALLTETVEKLGTELQWGWDERWNSALMVLQGEEGQAFLLKLADVFGTMWTHENIATADQGVQDLAQNMGGLRAGQKLYATAIEDGAIMYAASWPWVGNSHLSIRIGIYGGDHHLSVRTIFAPDSLKPKS
ncbi:MAG: hypothetical protein HOI23_08205 [Deltaproteobacteria bacterium]|jgi:hypothetical protein|nr:hypothetical protein [Deltaproteobacteria bacterium]MBT6433301.1 hypothetical protein [Deltaproteobacteria bacterium]MBT6489554.1 hypothetical protein [Deltaproteobacteria bacterium]